MKEEKEREIQSALLLQKMTMESNHREEMEHVESKAKDNQKNIKISEKEKTNSNEYIEMIEEDYNSNYLREIERMKKEKMIWKKEMREMESKLLNEKNQSIENCISNLRKEKSEAIQEIMENHSKEIEDIKNQNLIELNEEIDKQKIKIQSELQDFIEKNKKIQEDVITSLKQNNKITVETILKNNEIEKIQLTNGLKIDYENKMKNKIQYLTTEYETKIKDIVKENEIGMKKLIDSTNSKIESKNAEKIKETNELKEKIEKIQHEYIRNLDQKNNQIIEFSNQLEYSKASFEKEMIKVKREIQDKCHEEMIEGNLYLEKEHNEKIESIKEEICEENKKEIENLKETLKMEYERIIDEIGIEKREILKELEAKKKLILEMNEESANKIREINELKSEVSEIKMKSIIKQYKLFNQLLNNSKKFNIEKQKLINENEVKSKESSDNIIEIKNNYKSIADKSNRIKSILEIFISKTYDSYMQAKRDLKRKLGEVQVMISEKEKICRSLNKDIEQSMCIVESIEKETRDIEQKISQNGKRSINK